MDIFDPFLATLLVLHSFVFRNPGPPSALVLTELPSWKPGFEQLINLFKATAFDFWEVEEEPDRRNKTRRCPDVAVFGTPVEGVRIDKVGRSKRCQPLRNVSVFRPVLRTCTYCSKETDSCGKSESV